MLLYPQQDSTTVRNGHLMSGDKTCALSVNKIRWGEWRWPGYRLFSSRSSSARSGRWAGLEGGAHLSAATRSSSAVRERRQWVTGERVGSGWESTSPRSFGLVGSEGQSSPEVSHACRLHPVGRVGRNDRSAFT